VQTPALTPMHATGVVVTQRGRVPISWNRSAPGYFSLDVTIPANVVADVHVPVADVHELSDGGRSITDDPGVTSVRATGGEVVLRIGSGHYAFRVPSQAPKPQDFPWQVPLVVALGALVVGALVWRRFSNPTASRSRG
jgi:Bacterial alpha-L-rhamnosidase C-terminal domain